MKCTLEGNNARVFAKAIQSLSKVGRDLFLEADKEGLRLRAINPTLSAMGSIRFQRRMFQSFQLTDDVSSYCKIAVKSCLGIFRNMKQVEYCELCILSADSKFQVKLRCKLETMKQALITIVDEQNITAAVASDNMPNMIRGDYKLFMEISNNFNAAEEELTLEATSENIAAKNYIEGARVNDKFMRSQLKLKPCEFEGYNITKDAILTFCLKEFRALLQFAEALSETMTLEFDQAGSPIFLKIQKFNEIDCLLIMSTLASDDISLSEDYCSRDISLQKGLNTSTMLKRKSAISEKKSVGSKRQVTQDTTLGTSGVDTAIFQFNEETSNQQYSVQPPRLFVEDRAVSLDKSDVNDNNNDAENTLKSTVEATQRIPSSNEVYFYNTEETHRTTADDESIPPSPVHENTIRKIFSRCFQNTYVPREPSPTSEMYVPNSDTED